MTKITIEIKLNPISEQVDSSLIEQIDKLVLDVAPMAIISTNFYGDIMTVNPAVRSIFGYLEGELEGESLLKLVPELADLSFDSYQAFTARGELELFDETDKVVKSRQTTDDSNFLERYYYGIQNSEAKEGLCTHKKNGDILWITLFVNRVAIHANEFYILVISDITETKLKEQEIISLNESLELRVNERTKEVEEAHSKVTLLLDSSAQGFLAVDRALNIDPECSKVCESIFEQEIEGLCIADLLFPDNKTQIANLHKNIVRILDEDDLFIQDLYLCLLNDEYQILQKTIEIEFKYITTDRVVLILTDITSRKKLEHKLNHERDRLKFIVSTVQDPTEFFDVIDDFELFISTQLDNLLTSNRSDIEKLNETFRQVHTFKGGFSQLDFLTVPTVLHQLEDQLKTMQDSDAFNCQQLRVLFENSHCLQSLKKDIDIIEEVLGSEFLNSDKDVTLNLLQVKRIESFISEQEPGPVVDEVSDLLKDLMKSRLVAVKSLFRTFPKSTEKLAVAFDKTIHPFEITGKDLLVDANLFAGFAKSLIHVFRNAIDHGIESPDDRVAADKDEMGTIRCHIKNNTEYMVITISDDGRGLDLDKIRATAVDKQLYTQSEIESMNDKKVSKLIFDDRFSTKTVVTVVSGRGVGLSAVLCELKKLGGDVKIATGVGEGTKFQFVLPYNEDKV